MKLTHLMVHCSFTRATMNTKALDILKWHLGPKDILNKAGKIVGVRYKGKIYNKRMNLPANMIGRDPVFKLKGRGWRVPGYPEVIERAGNIETLVPYDKDDHVDDWEITNGAKGWNGHTRHICLIGGMGDDGKTEDNFLPSQLSSLEAWVKSALRSQPDLKLIGHNQVSTKACPGFNVPIWGRKVGIGLENLDFHDYGEGKYFRFLKD